MVKNSTGVEWEAGGAIESANVAGLRGLRWQARELLKRLESNRALAEQRNVEKGRHDPIKSITGQSALDSAIAATRSMIQRIDNLLLELDSRSTESAANEERVLSTIGSSP